jgi:hypothetical protein
MRSGADTQAQSLVGLVDFAREKHHGNGAGRAQSLQELDPVHARHENVDDREIRRPRR